MPASARFDAIVVGSGAAGGWAAKELTERGLTVLLLEAGPSIDPEVDFPLPAPRESRIASRTRGLVRQPVQMRCAMFNNRTARFFVDDRDNPYTTAGGKPFNWFRGRQVGGRLHTWARLVVRLSDFEFKAASRDGYGQDWPLSYGELAPYYDRVESFLGIAGCADGLEALPDGLYARPFALTPSELAFRAAVEAASPERRVVAARVVQHDRERLPRTLRVAQGTGRLLLRSDAVVRSLVVDAAGGRATGVTFVDRRSRRVEEARAGSVVLCASALETVRVLLNSAGPRHPGGLGNSGGRLGRGIMDHIMVALAGPGSAAEVEDRTGEDPDPYDFGRATGFLIPRVHNLGDRHPRFRRGYMVQGGIGRGESWFLLAQGEMLARAENRVSLDPARRDAWGIPAAHIECAPSDNEAAMIDDAAAVLRQIAAAAGLTARMPPSGRLVETLAFRLWRSRLLTPAGAFVPGSAVHEVGGAAIGTSACDSVANRFGQLWDAPNVFVADGAAFPSGCCQNVTLTIMALAVRACEHLVREQRAGRL